MTDGNAFFPYVIIYFLAFTSWNVSFYKNVYHSIMCEQE